MGRHRATAAAIYFSVLLLTTLGACSKDEAEDQATTQSGSGVTRIELYRTATCSDCVFVQVRLIWNLDGTASCVISQGDGSTGVTYRGTATAGNLARIVRRVADHGYTFADDLGTRRPTRDGFVEIFSYVRDGKKTAVRYWHEATFGNDERRALEDISSAYGDLRLLTKWERKQIEGAAGSELCETGP